MDRTDITLNKNVVKAVERELRKAERLYKSVDKKLATIIAELSIEQAQLTLNKLKAKSPKVIASIQTKLDAVNSKIEELQKERGFNDCNFRELKDSSYAYLAE
jgi:phage shock protein A